MNGLAASPASCRELYQPAALTDGSPLEKPPAAPAPASCTAQPALADTTVDAKNACLPLLRRRIRVCGLGRCSGEATPGEPPWKRDLLYCSAAASGKMLHFCWNLQIYMCKTVTDIEKNACPNLTQRQAELPLARQILSFRVMKHVPTPKLFGILSETKGFNKTKNTNSFCYCSSYS